jgi:hypothetical protein
METILTQFSQFPLPLSSVAVGAVASLAQTALIANANMNDSSTPTHSTTSIHNSTNASHLGSGSSSPLGFLANIWALLLSYPAIRDGAKLFILGGAIEFARRGLGYLWITIVESFFITAEFADGDETYSECFTKISRNRHLTRRIFQCG